MRAIRASDCPVVPWKNGRGTSRVIAVFPEGAGFDDCLWHVSQPAIDADGPFSALPGLDRHFLLLDGAGVELHCASDADRVDFRHVVERPFAPFAFRGDWTTACRLLDGPVQVLNVMARRGRAGAIVAHLDIGETVPVAARAGETLLLFAADRRVRALGSGRHDALDRYDTLAIDGDAGEQVSLSPAGAAPVAVIAIRLHSSTESP